MSELKNWDKVDKIRPRISQIFTLKFVYIKEIESLCCIYPRYNFMKKLFPTYLYAQNSTDQNYSYDTWDGIPYFERIRNTIKSLSPEEFKEKALELKYWNQSDLNYYENAGKHSEKDTLKYQLKGENLEYHKQSFIYKEIYDKILEDKVWGDNENSLSISCIWDYFDIRDAAIKLIHMQEEYYKELEEKVEAQN